MSHMRLWTAATIIAIVVIAGFLFYVPHASEVAQSDNQESLATTTPAVTLRDTFKKGQHTINGSLLAPSACSEVSATAELVSEASSTDRIRVAVTVATADGVCLQLPTTIAFSATVTAPANLPFIVTVNGSPASTTTP